MSSAAVVIGALRVKTLDFVCTITLNDYLTNNFVKQAMFRTPGPRPALSWTFIQYIEQLCQTDLSKVRNRQTT